jgi:hypothetical protein
MIERKEKTGLNSSATCSTLLISTIRPVTIGEGMERPEMERPNGSDGAPQH